MTTCTFCGREIATHRFQPGDVCKRDIESCPFDEEPTVAEEVCNSRAAGYWRKRAERAEALLKEETK